VLGSPPSAAPPDLPVLPLTRRNAYDQIAEDLALAVTEGRLRPGQALPPERELTRAYGVGRSSVREALRVLESRGLLLGTGRGGFVIADSGNPLRRSLRLLVSLDAVQLSELFEVRRILEVETCGLAAQRRTAADLAALAAAITEMAAGMGSSERFRGGDLGFHLALAGATHNRLAAQLMDALRDAVALALVVAYAIPGSPERALDQHRAILRAVADGDPDRARARMREHLSRVELDVRGVAVGGADGPDPGNPRVPR